MVIIADECIILCRKYPDCARDLTRREETTSRQRRRDRDHTPVILPRLSEILDVFYTAAETQYLQFSIEPNSSILYIYFFLYSQYLLHKVWNVLMLNAILLEIYKMLLKLSVFTLYSS